MKIIRPREPRLKIIRSNKFWSVHTHSKFSAGDALPSVQEIVSRVKEMGQPALGLMDHGNMGGSVELYKACKQLGIMPFPGTELYLVKSIAKHRAARGQKAGGEGRYHMGVTAYTTKGYENLVNLSTLSHKQFYFKPLVDLETFAQLHQDGKTEGLAVTTGCYFGLIVQALVTKGEATAKQYLKALDTWFPNSVFVEIQNHNIDHGDGWNDDKVADALVGIADELGLPVIITQDSHYTLEEDRGDHEALKRLVAFGPDPDDAVFPGDGFHLADDGWIEAHHGPARLGRGLEGLAELARRHALSIPVLDAYQYAVPLAITDPQAVLEQRCQAALLTCGKNTAAYKSRLAQELEVIAAAGMAGYLLVCQEVTDYMREQKILFNARGSAAGSLVCWLLRITGPDPIRWDLRFERFLSKDRTKPPDVDLDIEHERRGDVLTWMKSKWSVQQIATWAKLSLTGEEGESKGSLLVKYYSATNKKVETDEEKINAWSEVPREDQLLLKRLADREMYSGNGKNAAGVVVTATKAEIDKLVPMLWIASSESFLTQYGKNDIELCGFVKLDVMGVKMLSVIRRCLDLLGKDDLEWIPLTNGPTYSAIRSGMTEGVFQLSGWSAQRGCQELKPSKISDVIAAMALFRPATQSSGATAAYLARKHGKEDAPTRHEIITKATSSTYGIMLYQEQVIQVLRDLGMEADDLTKFLKAVKASNKDIGDAGKVIDGYQQMIAGLSAKKGLSAEDVSWLSTAIDGFSQYGFNSAHATTYGLLAYQTAYLMVNHPIEFHTALLAVAAGDEKKEPKYLRAARQRGVKILAPDVNISGLTYTMDHKRKAVRKGLLAIKGVGVSTGVEVARCQPYKDLNDLLERVDHRKVTGVKDVRLGKKKLDEATGALKALYQAGALNSLME
jgi:DNA polymerase-3 subunit alpha